MKRKFVLALVASMAMLGAKADGPFRNARWDSFHCLKPAGTDIVFVGNSITNMHQWWEALGGQNNVLNRGTSGGFTTEVLSNLEAITAGHPKKVFIGIGTNDICEVLSLETTADNVRIIAERIARECPETEVYIQSLIPSTSDGNHVAGGGRNGRIPQVNALYKAKAEALAAQGLKVKFLDVNTPLASSSNPNALKTSASGQSIAFDNLHPNAVGYKYWLDTIKDETGFNCIYEDKPMVGGMSNNNAFGDCLTSFEQFTVKNTDILMVGGDAIHNGEWHELMKSGDFKNRGLGWGKFSIAIDQFYTIVERSLAAEGSVAPKAIVLYADKDSNAGTAAATQMETLKTAIRQIKEKAPNSEIFVISTLPNTNAARNTIVTQFNDLLASNAATVGYTYVDAYTDINTDRALYMNNTDYVYTRGYAKMANVLAQALNAKLGTTYNPISEDEAAANVANYEARTTLGNAVTDALRVLGKEGEGVGQYPASALTGISDKTNNAFSILSAASFDATAAATAAEELRNLDVSATPNLPLASTANAEHWYTLVSSQRGSRYVGSNGTRTIGYSDGNVFARNQWKFVARGENSFDIINRQDNRYLAPSSNNASLALSADQPASGWEFSYGVTAGTFIIQNGTCEINMTDQDDGTNKKVVNWSANYAGNDHSDAGCQFTIEEYTGDASSVIYLPVSSTDSENHFYTIQSKRGGRYVTKSESDVRGIAETSNGAYWRFYDRGDGTYDVKAVNETYLNPADGQTSISAPSTGWTLSASNEAGYVILKSGSNQLHQYNSGQYLLGNWGSGTTLGDEGCQFRIAAYEGDVQLEEAPEVVLPTEDANVIVSPNNGTGVGSSFTKQWISNDKLVTISVGANNMTANNGNIDFRSGQAKTATYTIAAAEGYYVSGYSFVTTGANSITITGNGSTATASAEGTPFSATVTEGTTASFTVADNANSQNVLSNFHVRLTPVGAQPSTNIDGTELDAVYYTLTNHQKNNTTYTLFIYNGELKVSSANASATSLGDAALFTKEVHGDKWAFKSKTTGQYLVWRGSNDGYNGNKGVTDSFNATYCDFTPKSSTNYPGGYYFVGKRSNGTADGSWVIKSDGNWDKYSDAEGWDNGYSNIFTLDEVVGEEGKTISISNGTGTFNNASGFRNTWTSSSTPVVTVKAYAGTENINNMQMTDDGSAFVNYTGSRNGGSKLTVSVPAGYVITGYSFDVTKNNGDGAVTLTTPNNSSWSISSIADAKSETYTFPEGVQSFDLGFTGANEGLKFTNFKVTVKEYVVDPSTITYPFVSDEAFTEATHWYAIKLNGKYCYAADNNSVQLNPRTPDTTKEEYLWCVTGNNADGYTIYNKKAQKAITFASGADKTYATLADPTANNNSAFIVATSTASSNPQAYSFHFGANSYLNDYAGGGTLAIWDNTGGANGNGSGLMFIEPAEGIEDAIAPFYVFDNVESKQTTGVPYRIPAVAKNRAGDLVFAADYRYSKADIGMATNGKLDLRFRIKKADGTWTDVETLVSNGKWKKAADGSYVKDETNGTFTAFGDPCIVADRESDLVMVTSCCGNVSFPNGTPENHQGWSRFISTDGGYHWSESYIDLAPQVFEQINKRTDGYQLKCFFIGSGKISQSRTVKVGDYYRLYCSALATVFKGESKINVNYVFYSDDFGEKWHLLGSADDCPIPSDANEPKAEELPDGSVVVSSRTGGRHFNVYHYTNTATGEGAWGNRVTSNKNNNGTWGANCNGEIMTVPVKKTGTEEKSFLFLQSIPRDANRNYVGIFWKPLNNLADYRTTEQIAPNWGDDHFLQLSTTTSAYSTMCMDNKNDIAFFYEENDFNSGYDMVYKNVTISQLTNGAYEYCEMTHADSVAYLSAGVDPFVESVKATNFGPYVGQYAESAQSTIEAATAAYKAAPATATYDALNTALATATTRRINPAKQYRLINLGRTGKAMVGATEKFTGAAESADAANQRFVFESAGDGKWYLKSKDANVYFGKLAADETEVPAVTTTDNAGTFIIEVDSNGNAQFLCTNKSGSHAYIHLAGDNTRLVPWNAGSGSPASQWHILPIDEPLDITNEGEYTQLDVEALTNIVSGVATKENNESAGFRYNFDAADLNDDNVYTIGDIAHLIRLLLESSKK